MRWGKGGKYLRYRYFGQSVTGFAEWSRITAFVQSANATETREAVGLYMCIKFDKNMYKICTK